MHSKLWLVSDNLITLNIPWGGQIILVLFLAYPSKYNLCYKQGYFKKQIIFQGLIQVPSKVFLPSLLNFYVMILITIHVNMFPQVVNQVLVQVLIQLLIQGFIQFLIQLVFLVRIQDLYMSI